MVAFKANWLVILSNECPTIFCSWPNRREKQDNFWMGKHRLILSLNYLLLVGVMLTIKKTFIILWEYRTPWQCFKQITSLSFQLSVQVYYLLGQTEGERKACFGEWCKWGHIVRLPPIGLGCHKRWESPFLWNLK